MSEKFYAVIPARYASARLPGKALADIGGRPMIAWVYDRAMQSGADEVLIATDDERIASACADLGASVEMTSVEHVSGTDRIAEVAERRGWSGEDIVVNVQGDEPFLSSRLVSQVASVLRANLDAEIATLMTPALTEKDRNDPNSARVVVDRSNRALYFSRARIPSPRDGGESATWRHIGLYAYRVAALRELAATPPCELELVEKLEQLRALWLGMRIAVAEALEEPPAGVDTQEDLDRVREMLVVD